MYGSFRGATVLGAVIVMGVVVASPQIPSDADVPRLETADWRGQAPQAGEQLLLRRDVQAERFLLLKHSGRAGAYRYDRQTRSLARVTDQDWASGGPIAECGTQVPPPPQVLRIDGQSHTLMSGSRRIDTAGKTVLQVTASPGGRSAAVLSASGQKQPSLLPSLGTGGGAGQHYHQIVSLPDAAIAGAATRIPVRREGDVLGACWSADEKTIVYHDILFAYLSVVDADFQKVRQ